MFQTKNLIQLFHFLTKIPARAEMKSINNNGAIAPARGDKIPCFENIVPNIFATKKMTAMERLEMILNIKTFFFHLKRVEQEITVSIKGVRLIQSRSCKSVACAMYRFGSI